MSKTKLMLGYNLDNLKKLPDNSIDSVVTDPPYGLSFMNKKWDYDVPSVDFWKEVYRVLKPGGHILSFGGTRTYHRMVVNIEDAGFEIRDQIMWLYGSGFPKSHNIGKAVDKLQGNEREVVKNPNYTKRNNIDFELNTVGSKLSAQQETITKGQSDFEGWGTALKPANEPICLARKPLSEKSVAENVLKWKTGGINVDGCRVGNDIEDLNEGRFPANIILECICDEVIKGEKGEVKKSGGSRDNCDLSHEWGYDNIVRTNFTDKGDIHTNPNCPCYLLDEQSGISKSGASRFFYQAKVSKAERNMGLDGFEDKETNGSIGLHSVGVKPTKDNKRIQKNIHPTVKPINLMAYLCRLITPKNGIVLDPFMGSGSTGISAQLEGFRFVGMEMDEDYFKIASKRIENFEEYRKFIK